jgi:hypothetical protein
MQNANGALQLLLIVDWICSWAKDVYRPAVRQCLAQGTLDPREMTPLESIYSSQGDGSRSIGDQYPRTLAYRPSRQSSLLPELSANYHDASMSSEINDAMDVSPIETWGNPSHLSENLGEQMLQTDGHPPVVTRRVTSRLEKWYHLSIPESLVALKEILHGILPAKSHKEAASRLLEILLHDANKAIVSLLTLSDLLGSTDDWSQFSDLPGEEPVLVLLACQNWLDPPDWQIVRAFTCISCTPEAARQLSMLADRNDIIPSLSFWRVHHCNCLLSAVNQFGLWDVRQSVEAAWLQDIFCIIPGGNGAERKHLGWSRCAATASQTHIDNLQSILASFRRRGNTRLAHLSHSQADVDPMVRQLIDTTKLNDFPGVLIRRSSSWLVGSALWCYLMFEQQPHDSAQEPSYITRVEAPIYAEGSLSAQDEALLRAWSSGSD